MSEGHPHRSTAPTGPATARRRWLPFWVLQASEIAVALVFVDISVHIPNGGLLVASAIAFLGLAATADGPLGIVRLCRQQLHLILVITVAALVAGAPIVPGLRPDLEGIIVLEFGAIGLIRVATLTQAVATPRLDSSGRRRGSAVIDTTATVVDPVASGDGKGVRTGEDARDGTDSRGKPPASGAARWAGRTAAAAAASGKQATARYGPEAEAQVRRTIRRAGRLAGKVATRLAPRDEGTG